MSELGIVIVTYNSAPFITDCLQSIPADHHPRTIVIDNNSTDNTALLVRTGFPQIRLIVNPVNVGYARANNQGIRLLPDVRYILLLNPDTRLPADGINRMTAYLDDHPEVGVLAPKLINPDGTVQASVRRLPTYRNLLPELFGIKGAYRMRGFDADAVQEVEQPMASCLLIRRTVFEQVGLFDERFPMYFNDVDLSKRIIATGWKTVYYPAVAVWHYRGGSTSRVRIRMIREMHNSLFRYFAKHDQSGWFWLKAVPLAIVIQLIAAVRILVTALRGQAGLRSR